MEEPRDIQSILTDIEEKIRSLRDELGGYDDCLIM